MTSQKDGHKEHFVQLDGLRGIAALVVVYGHCREILPPSTALPNAPVSALAVDFFFMLSGFVVAYAYENKLKTSLSFIDFMKIRLIRLWRVGRGDFTHGLSQNRT